MSLSDLIVVEIVCRGYLDAAGTELWVDIVIGDDRNQSIAQGQRNHLSYQVAVAGILGMHRHRRVTEQGLRAGSRNHQMALARGQRVAAMP